MKKALLLLSIIFLINPSFSGVSLTLNNRLYIQGDIINLKIDASENYTGTATLKICLSNYDFIAGSYSQKCDTLLQEQEIYINNEYSDNFPIITQNIPDSAYRIYLQLKFKQDGTTKTRQSCNDKNFILIKPKNSCQTSQQTQGIILSAQTINESYSNETVTATVTLSNHDSNEQILLYSFIKNQTHYISKELDQDSFKILNTTLGSTSIILMKNKLIESISPGLYEHTIKAEINGRIYQSSNTIQIKQKEIIEEPSIECICEEKECPTAIIETQIQNEFAKENAPQEAPEKITAQLSLKRNEYYYLSTIIIGIISLIIMYVKLK